MVFYWIFLVILWEFMPYTSAATTLLGLVSPNTPWPIGIVFLYEMWLKNQNKQDADEAPRVVDE